MLEAHDLTVYAADICLLDRVNMQLSPGEFVAVLGPNGAGKSTLMDCLGGARRAAGKLLLDGRDPARLAPHALAIQRAVLEQSPRLSAPFRAAELVRLGIPRAVATARAERIVADVIHRLDLASLAERVVPTLSGGEQLRCHMARVLAQLYAGRELGGGRYLMIDEPTASLDLRHQVTVLRVAHQASREGAGVLAILHDPTLAASVADRILMLKNGRIVAEGPPRYVLTADRLAEFYGMPIHVHHRAGGVTVTPDYSACLQPSGT